MAIGPDTRFSLNIQIVKMSAKKFTTYPSSTAIKELSGHFEMIEEHNDLPILILPKIVLFPGQSLPISSLEGLRGVDFQLAQKGLLRVAVLSQVDAGAAPKETEMHLSLFGTEAIITGLVKMTDGTFGAILKGVRRLIVNSITKKKFGFTGHVTILGDKSFRQTPNFLASVKVLKNLVNKVIKLNPNISQETLALIYTTEDPVLICDLITPYLSIVTKEKLEILSSPDFRLRMKNILKHLSREVDLLQLSTRIQDQVHNDMQENMKKAFLREQIAAIKRELGELDGDVDEIEELETKFGDCVLSKEAKTLVDKEVERLSLMHPGSPEYMVSWNYLTWVKDLPWALSDSKKEIIAKIPRVQEAARILDKSHYGLQKVKERILEYIAILQRNGNLNGQILLLYGPPGVGKTSLVRSIANALDRPFVQISLGGVKDEAEVRGHRRTYIGAMPGKIIQAMKTAGRRDPVILLDEVDKVGTGALMQSDLSSALLEILDPEQNKQFTDHYLGFPFDLSKVLFITTANSLDGISKPLLDRMEIIELSSYTETEKVHIAKTHITPSVRKEFKLSASEFSVDEDISRLIIRRYTREAGVRQLKRDFAAIGRKIVRRLVAKKKLVPVDMENIHEYLGQPRYSEEPNSVLLPCGVAIGLAYTSFGGEILYIESRKSKSGEGKSGGLTVTGSLGKVMKESIQTVFSYILSQCELLGLKPEDLEKSNIHVHFPDGATPKDGPSAGVAILSALVSLFSERAMPAYFAMTGEITLRGKVLPVGGIKEKFLAAHRYGKRNIIFPQDNWTDLDELPSEVLKDFNLYPIDNMLDALLIMGLLDETDVLKRPKASVYLRRCTLDS
jgi:ATP-dependent Lon protease